MTLPLFSACAQKRKSQGHEQGHSDHGRKALINSCGHGHDFSQARRHIALAAVILCEAHQLAISSDGTRVAVACGRGQAGRHKALAKPTVQKHTSWPSPSPEAHRTGLRDCIQSALAGRQFGWRRCAHLLRPWPALLPSPGARSTGLGHLVQRLRV